MPYCSRCGVEVDKYIKFCPLCNTKIKELDKTPNIPGNFPDDEMISKDYYIPFEKKKKITWSVFSFLITTALFIVFAVNFLISRKITWAWIPLFSLLLTWGLTALVYYLFKKTYFFLLSFFIMITVYLFFLFFVIQYTGLFFMLALPINTAVFINIILVVLSCKKVKNKGYNIIGFILTGTALICVAIDIVITFYITSKIIMTWSIAAISLLVPIIAFLFYVHYILRWTPDIKKIFHI